MHPLDELKDYVGFTVEDSERLQAFADIVDSDIPGIIDRFYERILSSDVRDVLRHETQVNSLKRTLIQWLHEALSGPHDVAYYERRERIGQRHVQVGLPVRFMSLAMNGIRADLCSVANERLDDPFPVCLSLHRITDIDLAIMTSTFVQSREARQFQALQDLLVTHLPMFVVLVDGDGIIGASTRTPLFSEGETVGRTWTSVVPPALLHAGRLETLVADTLKGDQPRDVQRVDVSLDGRDRSFRVTVVPLEHAWARFLMNIEELTDAVQTEAKVRRTEALAQLGSLSAAVAHELRNPLAGISGAIQVMHSTLPEGDTRAPIMNKIEEQIRRLDALVTDLLAFARPGAARLGNIDLYEVTLGVVELVGPTHSGIDFQIRGTGKALADTNLVHQILLNLAQNAALIQDDDGIVRFDISDGRIVVSDEGPGVPAESRIEIFQPFFTTRTRGTGLGLAVSTRAANAMNADIALLDEGPLQGASFALTMQPPR